MADPRHVAVIDIGKTNAKVALVDLGHLAEVAVRRMPNRVRTEGPYPHFDCDRIWAFILTSLAELQARHSIDTISVTTHGATAALLDADGELALPILDYEFTSIEETAAAYDRIRPPFDETGSPRLPAGLNLGAQLFWQSQLFPDAFARVRTILTYAQYWSYRLCGMAASEATSLGCHTDLWNPYERCFSTLADALGIRARMAPVRPAGDVLGPITAAVSSATGMAPTTQVHCGIHDSNASLLPHLLSRQPPFTVVSTGTWVIAMAVGAAARTLDPTRDTLVNVNARGDAVPSARFMGGREFSLCLGDDAAVADAAESRSVFENRIMLLPSLRQGSGPFPDRIASWSCPPERLSAGKRFAVVSAYLALMTATCIDLIGGRGPSIVEGPFAGNDIFLETLAAATGRPVIKGAGSATGTSLGAALLAARCPPAGKADVVVTGRNDGGLKAAYAEEWRRRIELDRP